MGNKKLLDVKKVFLSITIILILFAVLVIAATGDAIKIRAPATGNNFSAANITGNIPTLFNITFLNGSDLAYDVVNQSLDTLNVTFYINISGTGWLIVGNSTNCVRYNGIEANISCAAYLNASALLGNQNNMTGNGSIVSDGYYTVNATIFNNTAARLLSRGLKAGNLTTIIIDNNGPLNVNLTGLNGGQNHSTRSNSGNLTLNVSIADTVSQISSVIFNIINTTGNVNKTLIAVQEGTGQYWSTSVNTSEFKDGNYSISVFVNDSVGNFNVTANNTAITPARTLFFDNSLPSVTISCTPSSVIAGDTVTCTCSGSATSGINSTSVTANPSTSNTGTYTETCSVTSLSGLTNTNSDTYTVEINGGTSSGGGSSSSASNEQKSTKFVEIQPDTPAVVKNFEKDYGLKEIVIDVKEKASNVKISVSKSGTNPSGTSKKDGNVYKYLIITHEGLGNKLESATISIKVEKTWVNEKKASKDNLALFKYMDNTWKEMSTTFKSEDGDYYYYDSIVDSFSIFAIGEKVLPAQEEQVAEATTQLAPETTEEKKTNLTWLWIAIIVIGAILIISWLIKRKKH